MKIPAISYRCDLCARDYVSILDENGKEVYSDSWIHDKTFDICVDCRLIVERAIKKCLVYVVQARR